MRLSLAAAVVGGAINAGRAMGHVLRSKLREVLLSWGETVQMWTLTLDPGLFASPAHALDYVRKNRLISRLVRELRRGGWVGEHWFCVLEFHANGYPHFHLLVPTRYVPFSLVCKVWGNFRPKWAGEQTQQEVEADRPRFGAVRFSKSDFKSVEHAANYVTKYVTKTPRSGLPQWVLDSTDIIHRYFVSRGFWGSKCQKREQPCVVETHLGPYLVVWRGVDGVDLNRERNIKLLPIEQRLAALKAEKCLGHVVHLLPRAKRVQQSIKQRVAICGKRSAVFRVDEVTDGWGEITFKRSYICDSAVAYETLQELCGTEPRRSIHLPRGSLELIAEVMGIDPAKVAGDSLVRIEFEGMQ